MKKITVITQNLCGGGVQKSVVTLINTLSDVYDVSLLLFEDKEPFYDVSCPVKILSQFKIDVRATNAGEELFELRKSAVSNFYTGDDSDLYIVFEDYNSLVVLASDVESKRVAVSSRVSRELYKGRRIHLLDEAFYQSNISELYPKAGLVTAVSEGVAGELADVGVNAIAVPNGIDVASIKDKIGRCDEQNFILHVGRIDFGQKAQDETLTAYSKVADKVAQGLVFIGSGKDSKKLDEMIAEHKLEGRVKRLDESGYIFTYMSACDLLVFSSYYEGMPNVLLEALACGVPVISYEFVPSFEELNRDDALFKVGRGDVDELADAIFKLSSNADLRRLYRDRGFTTSKRYDIKYFKERWLEIADKLLSG